ncbi:acyl-[acyl-carrier-protein] thioesterase [Sunxiuqinia dokdonensis]|uniref:Acyl-ACP thioesterase n=1 Tax=Sunxiuqinia dokdonensis TaxID=1409788 RepID=A0A0L8V517_9BACT|nr:acyl-ACP thioesterase domain-containing protein [Sunxiuqinia dokdonensis]KOH43529.1 acyl-ACP thioesterase [Sunxiuqinia dokdonensis]
MQNYFEKQFQLRYFEMNKFGEASPTTVLTLLEEAAADHCYSINHSLYDLEKQNIGWVLLSGVMEMDRYPKYKEKITIRTWLSSYSKIKGFRENIIYDGQDCVIGRAKGLWVFFDIKRKRPIQILDDIKEKWGSDREECIDHDISKKIEAIDSGEYANEFRINRFDVDANLHVNNIRYLQWMIESMPKDITDNYDLNYIDGRFIAEAHYGDTIFSHSKIDVHEHSFSHTIKTQSNIKDCATAKTQWKERK